MSDRTRPIDEPKQRRPLLTLAAFALLLLIPALLVAGDISVSATRVTIDLPFIEVNGPNEPDFNLGR